MNDNDNNIIKKIVESIPEPDNQFDTTVNRIAEIAAPLDIDDNSTSVYQQARIKAVALELMNGLSPSQIWDKYGEKWQITEKNLETNIVPKARKFLATQVLTEENDIRIDLLAKYNYLYTLNFQRGDLRECRFLLDSLVRLTQTLTQNVNINANIQTIELVQVLKQTSETLTKLEENTDEFEN